MVSIMKLVTFIVGIVVANCTRIPMEIVQLSSTQMTNSNNHHNDTHHQAKHAEPTVAALAMHQSTTSTKLMNGFELRITPFDQHQQRKGRQLVDSFTFRQPRILYQVGVSAVPFSTLFLFIFSSWIFPVVDVNVLVEHRRCPFLSQMSTSAMHWHVVFNRWWSLIDRFMTANTHTHARARTHALSARMCMYLCMVLWTRNGYSRIVHHGINVHANIGLKAH